MSLATPEKLQRLQEVLYAKAKQEPSRRFHFLYDKVWRDDILAHAFALSRKNGGAPGVDGETFSYIETKGVERWVNKLKEELRTGRYKPQPVRRVMIPKSSGVGQRPLGIPTIRDRVVQTAAKLVIEPIFEADFDEAAYGYRPGRSAIDAVRKIHKAMDQGHYEVVDADLSKYFDTIPHSQLMKCLARRISDGKMLRLIKMWLKAPVEETDERRNRRMSGGKKATRGTPQGGVASPILANIYMHRYIKAFRRYGLDQKHDAVLVNYADDLVVLCRQGAQGVLEITRRWMTRIGLALNEEKTCLRNARCGSFDFLGYTFGPMYSPRTGGCYNGARPSKKAIASIKEAIRQRLRNGNQAPWEEVVRRLNQTLRGWAAYYCYGSLAKARHDVDQHLYHTVRRFLRRRHKLAGPGYRQFPEQDVFGKLGVLSLQRLPRPGLRMP
ncbi:MAG TPA: group II intron reverse transcriptase/maturase [Methylomirabilota bacterium]|nr:group II intron reverse transcriptase/maturase [Methylomirabilota bacterium]